MRWCSSMVSRPMRPRCSLGASGPTRWSCTSIGEARAPRCAPGLARGPVKAGLEIRENPSFELERRAGVSNLNAVRDGLRVLRTMLGQGDVRRDAATIPFTLRKIHLPIWSADRVPSGGERRWIDRRRFSRAGSGYTWTKPHVDERRRTVGSVVAYRADYEQSPRQPAA